MGKTSEHKIPLLTLILTAVFLAVLVAAILLQNLTANHVGDSNSQNSPAQLTTTQKHAILEDLRTPSSGSTSPSITSDELAQKRLEVLQDLSAQNEGSAPEKKLSPEEKRGVLESIRSI